jgi:hypothetical protein
MLGYPAIVMDGIIYCNIIYIIYGLDLHIVLISDNRLDRSAESTLICGAAQVSRGEHRTVVRGYYNDVIY